MPASTQLKKINGRPVKFITLSNKNGSVTVSPTLGLSIVSFKWKGRELLDPWDLKVFAGSEKEIELVANNMTDVFRKGFGPSIGPWFGQREEKGTYWQHGVCRFADWKDLKVVGNSVTGRLNGKKDRLTGKTLNDLCGFEFGVEITYTLTEEGLEYKVKNRSAGNKGTYGIHWYWKNPKHTSIRLRLDPEKLDKKIDPSKYAVSGDEVVVNADNKIGQIFPAAKLGINRRKGVLEYADGSSVEFYYDDVFAITVLFNTRKSVCFEPVSGMPHRIGTFKEGIIRMVPRIK